MLFPAFPGDLLRSLSFCTLGPVLGVVIVLFDALVFGIAGLDGIAFECFLGFFVGLSTLSFSVHLKIYFPVIACSGQSFR